VECEIPLINRSRYAENHSAVVYEVRPSGTATQCTTSLPTYVPRHSDVQLQVMSSGTASHARARRLCAAPTPENGTDNNVI
jgi:hypothetical protein